MQRDTSTYVGVKLENAGGNSRRGGCRDWSPSVVGLGLCVESCSPGGTYMYMYIPVVPTYYIYK